MFHGNNKFVKFEFIEKLQKLKQTEGLHLGNKLCAVHMAWYEKRIKVKLAAQLLSESVASSLQFCLNKKLPGFDSFESTIKLISLFNNLFDILYSRNLKSRGYTNPLKITDVASVTVL